MKEQIISTLSSERTGAPDLQTLFERDPAVFASAAAEAKATAMAALAGDEASVRFLMEQEAFCELPLTTIAHHHLEEVTDSCIACIQLLTTMLPPHAVNTRRAFLGHPAFPHLLAGSSQACLTALYQFSLRSRVTREARAALLEAGAVPHALSHNGLTVAHQSAAWGDAECWEELPQALRRSGSHRAMDIPVKVGEDFYRVKAPAGSTPHAVATAALKIARAAAENEAVSTWIASLEHLLGTMETMPKKAPCTSEYLWERAWPPAKTLKAERGARVSDGDTAGTVLINVTARPNNWFGVLVRTDDGDFRWLERCWPVPKKLKSKPTAGDIKKLATVEHGKPDLMLNTLAQLRVKYSQAGFELLRWGLLAADENFLHRGLLVQQALAHGLSPTDDAAMIAAFANCGKGGVFEGSGPGLQALFSVLDQDWLQERLPTLPPEAQLAYAIAFPDAPRDEALVPWIIEAVQKGWRVSGRNRSELGELMRRFEISADDLPVASMLAKAKSIDIAEWSPLLVGLPKEDLLTLINKRSSKLGHALKPSFLRQRRERSGDSWDDSVEIVEAVRSRFPKNDRQRWSSLLLGPAGPVPDWTLEELTSTTHIKQDSTIEALSKTQLERLVREKADGDEEFRMLVSGEAPQKVPVDSIRAPRFSMTKERFAACLEQTWDEAIAGSKQDGSKEEKIEAYRRLASAARKYPLVLLQANGGVLTDRVFEMLLPAIYAHLDAPARRSILPDFSADATRAMTLEQLETYYGRWRLEFSSQQDFFDHFAWSVLAQPPAAVFAALQF